MKLDKQELVEIKEEIKHSAMSLQTQAILLELLRGVETDGYQEDLHDNACK